MTELGSDLPDPPELPSEHPLGELAGELYHALRGIARRALFKGSRLEPTVLVHQAWLRLARDDK
jgi:hypothetical protein